MHEVMPNLSADIEKDTLTEKITAFDVQLKDQNKILS